MRVAVRVATIRHTSWTVDRHAPGRMLHALWTVLSYATLPVARTLFRLLLALMTVSITFFHGPVLQSKCLEALRSTVVGGAGVIVKTEVL